MSDLVLDVHGLSHHYDTVEQFREYNPGLGLRYIERSADGSEVFLMVGRYRNSLDRNSEYLAVGTSVALSANLSAGVIAGVITGYQAHPVPAVIPTVSVGNERVRLTTLFIPKTERTPATLAVSFQIKFMEFE